MTDKEKIEHIDESDIQTPSISGWAEGALVETLKTPEKIPSDYVSWESSALRSGSYRDVKYIYWEWEHDIVWAVLVDYSYYPGGWAWMEYWVKLFVKRWDKTDMQKIVYRDSYYSWRDDWWKAYETIDSIEVQGDKIILKVTSSRRTDTYTFYLKKPDKLIKGKIGLSLEEQAKFKEYFESEKVRLLDKHTRKEWRYPASYDLTLKQIPDYFGSQWVHPYGERLYDKAEIIDEYFDAESGTACIVIKTQIDVDVVGGKQFQWLKYEITPKWARLVDTDQAYQSEMRKGKQIRIQAR